MLRLFLVNVSFYEFFLKYNLSTPYHLPNLTKLIVTVSLASLKSNFTYSLPILYYFFLILGVTPILLRIKKPSVSFKTRKSDPYGLMFVLERRKVYSAFEVFLRLFVLNMVEQGYSHSFGFSRSGNLQLGVASIKSAPFITETFLTRFVSLPGFSLNFFFDFGGIQSARFKIHSSLVFLSNLSYFNFFGSKKTYEKKLKA
jgi:ribosomal protein L5